MNRWAFALAVAIIALPTTSASGQPNKHVRVTDEHKAAQKLFEAGDTLYEAKRYQEAAKAFRQSYALIKSPNSRLMLARCLRELGNTDDAAREYLGTRADAEASGGKYDEALRAAIAEYLALQTNTALSPSPPTAPSPEAASRKPLRESELAPTTASSESETDPRQQPKQTPSSANRRPLSLAVWSASGVAAAGGVAFGVFAVLNNRTFKKLERDCPGHQCTSSHNDQVQTGKAYQLAANISLGVFAVGAIATTTLIVLSPKQRDSQPTATLNIGFGPGSLDLHGHF